MGLSASTLLPEIAPEFASETVERRSLFIQLAAQQVSPLVWGDLFATGVAYLAAHLLTLRARSLAGGGAGGAVGPVASERAGDLARGYGSVGAPDSAAYASLASTPHGAEYLRLLRTRSTRPVIVGA